MDEIRLAQLTEFKLRRSDVKYVYPSMRQRIRAQVPYHLRTILKKTIVQLVPGFWRLSALLELPKLRNWARLHSVTEHFQTRFDLYNHVYLNILKESPIAYLEFGVFKGETMKYWSLLSAHAESRFVGFDTFEGLPETWVTLGRDMPKGTFSTQGNMPAIPDARVSFIKGTFQQTLEKFISSFKPNGQQLVIHIDCDLYSGALYALSLFNRLITVDTIIIFDEFSSIRNEFRALQDYCSAFLREYKVLGHTGRNYDQVAIKITR